MKIAIPTSDRKTIFERTGRAKEFAIYILENGTYKFIEFIENPHKHEDLEAADVDEQRDHTHEDIVEALQGCDALLVKMAGKYFRQDFANANISLFIAKDDDLEEAINVFVKDFLSHKHL